ncbi:DUF3761 domain-containing protein [Nocardia aurantia]|uniref:DUF3761 domain-containing protein n=1 Tax=Nocardia aurantia TaxID=2585199 RepID=A0A7K0DY06_9NOCA|nr:hypothetical protein [Nocardia aurantia]
MTSTLRWFVQLACIAAIVGGGISVSPATAHSDRCPPDFYLNVHNVCVQRPEQTTKPPPGATTRCHDGASVFSRDLPNACSGHGGVGQGP